MTIGRRWSGIWRKRGRCGGGWQVSSAGRGRGCGCPDFSSKLSFSRCCYLGQRNGWLPPAWSGSWGIPVQGGAAIDGADPAEVVRQEVGIHLGGGGKGGGGFWYYGDVHLEKAEHGHAVHWYTIAYGPMWGDGEDAGGAGGNAVVGKGKYWSSRGKGDGGGGGGRGWAGRLNEGIKQKTPGLVQQQRVYHILINQIGTDYGVSLEYVQGVEHHLPTIRLPSGHRERLRRIRRSVSYLQG